MHAGREAMTWKVALSGVIVIIGVLCASEASAQLSSCTISSTSAVFGNYNVFSGSALDTTATITYQCNALSFNVTISLSKGQSSTYGPRRMNQGAEILTYNLYTNAGRSQIWGDGTGGTAVYSRNNPPNNSDVTVVVYGRVPADQDVSAGSYSDTVSATINF
jgi:spore coat protein U-like protein